MDDDADDDALSLAESTRYDLRKKNVSKDQCILLFPKAQHEY